MEPVWNPYGQQKVRIESLKRSRKRPKNYGLGGALSASALSAAATAVAAVAALSATAVSTAVAAVAALSAIAVSAAAPAVVALAPAGVAAAAAAMIFISAAGARPSASSAPLRVIARSPVLAGATGCLPSGPCLPAIAGGRLLTFSPDGARVAAALGPARCRFRPIGQGGGPRFARRRIGSSRALPDSPTRGDLIHGRVERPREGYDACATRVPAVGAAAVKKHSTADGSSWRALHSEPHRQRRSREPELRHERGDLDLPRLGGCGGCLRQDVLENRQPGLRGVGVDALREGNRNRRFRWGGREGSSSHQGRREGTRGDLVSDQRGDHPCENTGKEAPPVPAGSGGQRWRRLSWRGLAVAVALPFRERLPSPCPGLRQSGLEVSRIEQIGSRRTGRPERAPIAPR